MALLNKCTTNKYIDKNGIILKNYKYLVEVIDILNLFISDRILEVKLIENDDQIIITEEYEKMVHFSNLQNCKCDKNIIIKQLTQILLLLDKLLSINVSFISNNLLIDNKGKVLLFNWYDKLLMNEKISESEFYNSMAILFYSIIEGNNNEIIYKSIYDMIKNLTQINISEKNIDYVNILPYLMNNSILLEEIEIVLENENDINYVEVKEKDFKKLVLYYGSYHAIESIVKNWIDTEVDKVVKENSEQIKLWNCYFKTYEIEYLLKVIKLVI